MSRRLLLSAFLTLAVVSTSLAGVVVEMETRDLRTDRTAPPDRVYAQGEMMRMEPGDAAHGNGFVMIFRDASMFLVNAKEKSYYKMDEETIEGLSAQVNSAMKAMEAQLANMPKEQRAMMEKMMKDRFPGQAEVPEVRIEEEGKETIGEYSCRKYVLYQNDEKISEMFLAPTGQVEAADEAMVAFRAMARFAEKMVASFQNGPMSGMANHPFRFMDQMEGFPVLTRQFANGKATQEIAFKSATEQDLDGDLFSPPKGYKEAHFMKQGGR